MCSDFNMSSELFGEDQYEHAVGGLIYITSCCSGPGSEDQILTLKGCQCTNTCQPSTCSCMNLSGTLTSYEHRFDDPNPIVECNADCSCYRFCGNRIVQNGPRKGLKVLPTKLKGLGVFTSIDIPEGSFVCEYAGEIIGIEEARKRFKSQCPSDSNYILVLREHFVSESQITVVDPTVLGNIGRYINHSCDPNLKVVPVRTQSWQPSPALFAIKPIKKGDEICYDYESVTYFRSLADQHSSAKCSNNSDCSSIEMKLKESSDSFKTPVSPKTCLCFSDKCRKELPSSEELFS